MGKNFFRNVGLVFTIFLTFVSVSIIKADAAPSNATVTTQYVLLSDLSPEEQEVIVKKQPSFPILHDKENVKLVYTAISPDPQPGEPSKPEPTSPTKPDLQPTKQAVKPSNKVTKSTTNLPKAGDTTTNSTVLIVGSAVVLLSIALMIWKRKHVKTLLVLIFFVGGSGAVVIAEAAENVLPKTTTQLLPIGDATYAADTAVTGFDYIGYVHTYSDDAPVQEDATITVNYQNTEGTTLIEPTILTGKVGQNYAVEPKTIEGFIFKEVTGNATGIFTAEKQVITFIYEKVPVQGKVIVKYLDTQGNSVAPDDIINGVEGQNYFVEPKTIEGFDYKGVLEPIKGVFTIEDQAITYLYEPKPVELGTITLKQSGVVPNFNGNVYFKVTYYDLNNNIMGTDTVFNQVVISDDTREVAVGSPYKVYSRVTYDAYVTESDQRYQWLDYKLEAINPLQTEGIMTGPTLQIDYLFTIPSFG